MKISGQEPLPDVNKVIGSGFVQMREMAVVPDEMASNWTGVIANGRISQSRALSLFGYNREGGSIVLG